MGSSGKSGSSKVGGGGVVGGKGGGGKGPGKGKKGGGCAQGQVTLCFDPAVYASITAAFNKGIVSTKPSDGCGIGLTRVCLDLTTTQQLLGTIIAGLNLIVPKGKKKGKGKKPGGVSPKMKGKGRKGQSFAAVSRP